MSLATWQAISERAVMLSAIALCSGAAAAQSDAAISEAMLREPWVRELAVLESVAPLIPTAAAGNRTPVADALARLEAALADYEQRVDVTIDRIIADPQFSYVADQWSQELAGSVAGVSTQLEALYGALGVRDRGDVRAAQASLDALHEILERKAPFERDVVRAIGSFSRQQIVELATRWWNGEERAIAVKKKVAALRQALDEAPGDGTGG